MSYPRLKINLFKIGNNCKIINDRCENLGISVVGVSKCVLGDPRIMEVFKKNGIKIFGDSRLGNLKRLKGHFGPGQKLVLLRTPMISEIEEMLDCCFASINTQEKVVKEISRICRSKNKKHKILIMVETDDRREGLLPGEVLPFVDFIAKNCPGVEIWGLGTNARCISKRKPSLKSIGLLLKLKETIKKECNLEIPVISGGNSSIWKLLENSKLPEGINQVRIGEAIFLGHETADYLPIEGAFQDIFILYSEIIEIKQETKGHYKIITALGVQDVNCQHIIPTQSMIRVKGQSSDHTVLEVQNKLKLEVGDIISFQLDYFGLLASMTSPFVNKIYEQQKPE